MAAEEEELGVKEMDRLLRFLAQTESRDKLLKVLAYFANLVRAVRSNKDVEERLSGVFHAARDARKIFRLGKSLNEFHAILSITHSSALTPSDKTYHIMSRVGFMLYWLLDNIYILSLYDIIVFDYSPLSKWQNATWFGSLFLALLLNLRNLLKSFAEEAMLKDTAVGKMTEREVADKLDEISSQRWSILLNIAKTLGDMIPAANWAELPFAILGKQFSEKWCALGGSVAGIIGCYQQWTES